MKALKIRHLFFAPVLLAFLVFSQVEAPAETEMTSVIFECEDIGVEARRLLENLKEEQDRFKERKKRLIKREAELKILEAEVDKNLNRLTQIRVEVENLLVKKDNEENEMIKRLGRIYQKRDPAAAALTLAEMDKTLAVAILAVMRDKFAGEILDNMENETAVIYSTALGRLGE